MQSAQLHLADRAGLLQPSEALLDQPATAQADGIAGVPGGFSGRGSSGVSCRSWSHARDIQLARASTKSLLSKALSAPAVIRRLQPFCLSLSINRAASRSA